MLNTKHLGPKGLVHALVNPVCYLELLEVGVPVYPEVFKAVGPRLGQFAERYGEEGAFFHELEMPWFRHGLKMSS